MSGGPVRARWPEGPENSIKPFLPAKALFAETWSAFVDAFAEHYDDTTRRDFVTDESFPRSDDDNRMQTLLRFASVFRNDPTGIRGPGVVQYAGVATIELDTVDYRWRVGDRVAACGNLLDCEKINAGGRVLARIQINL